MVVKWQNRLPSGAGQEKYYKQFKKKAEELTVTVLRASSPDQALELIIDRMKALNIKQAVSSALTLIDAENLEKQAQAAGADLSSALDRDVIEKAGIGISEFELAIAESGTIVQDASSLHARLVSMLPPVHLAIVTTKSIVGTFPDALSVIENVYGGHLPPFLSFVTGPSKTADIERVLTIGVHGPKEVIVLFIDE